MHQATVVKWRKRFFERGAGGLIDEPRPGAPRKITDTDVEAVGRIWRAFGLKPWAIDTFKLSEEPQFIDKVRDVVGLYLDPPDKVVVLYVDEKTGIQRACQVLCVR